MPLAVRGLGPVGDAAVGISVDNGVPAADVVVEEKQQIVRVHIRVAGWRRVGQRDSVFVSSGSCSYGLCNVEAYEPGYI